jgi:hypothetical protein
MTLEKVCDGMAELGLTLDSSTFSHWQRGTRIPSNRVTVLKLIKVLFHNQGIRHLEEANQMLESVAMPPLTEGEGRYLKNRYLIEPPFEVVNTSQPEIQPVTLTKCPKPPENLEVMFNLVLPSDLHEYIKYQAKKQGISKATLIRRLIEDQMMEDDYTY